MATITGNFLSHYATGSTQAFSAPSLPYAECFMYEDPPNSGNKRYYRSLLRGEPQQTDRHQIEVEGPSMFHNCRWTNRNARDVVLDITSPYHERSTSTF